MRRKCNYYAWRWVRMSDKLKFVGHTDVEETATEEDSEPHSREADRNSGGSAGASGTLGRARYAVECVARPGRVGCYQAPRLLCSAAYERRFGARFVESGCRRRGAGCRQVFAGPRFIGCS